MAGLLRQGHFLGSKLRSLRKRNGLTLDELSARCVQLEPDHAPSVSYLSMVETGKRVPSPQMLGVLAAVFGKEPSWFLDRTEALPPQQLGAARHQGPVNAMALEPAFQATVSAMMPGFVSGRKTRKKVWALLAPRLREACSSLRSKLASAADTVIEAGRKTSRKAAEGVRSAKAKVKR